MTNQQNPAPQPVPQSLPGHERKPNWFDADRSGFSEPS